MAERPSRLDTFYANAWEAAVAFAAMIGALWHWFGVDDPGYTAAISRVLGVWDDIWYALYLLAGVCMLAGLLLHGARVTTGRFLVAGDGRLELTGLIFMSTALLVNFLALWDIGALSTPSAATFLALSGACAVRARSLLSARKKLVPTIIPDRTQKGDV